MGEGVAAYGFEVIISSSITTHYIILIIGNVAGSLPP